MKFQSPLSIIALVAISLAVAGCQNLIVPRGKFVPMRAEAWRMFDAQANAILNSHGDFSSQTRVIDDPAQVQKLAGYFPGLGEPLKEKHVENGSYDPSVEITFTSADHRHITVKTDYVLWNDDHGDRHIGGGFVKYIDQLFAGSK